MRLGPNGVLGTGRVAADGTLYGPSGWTCSHTDVGTYLITHNLHIEDPDSYSVLGTPCLDPLSKVEGAPPPQTSLIIVVGQQSADDFTVYLIEGSSLSYIDKAFNFGVFR